MNLNIFAANTEKKIASATQRRASNSSTIEGWPYLAFPEVEESSLLCLSCCLAPLTEAHGGNAKPRRLLFGANNTPLPAHLETQQTKSYQSRFIGGKIQKYPCAFLQSASSASRRDGGILTGTDVCSRTPAPAQGGDCLQLNLFLQYTATGGNCISVFR